MLTGMDLRVFTEPQQGATYDDLLVVAQHAERLGFSAFFRSDHYLAMGVDGRPGPTDAWLTLAALARETSTIRLGTLMTSATFRLPGPLAISVAQVDQMSGGRVELGIGAGWYEEEHTAYGIPFPDTGERFDRLEETLAIVTGLWATPPGETFDHDGTHYQLHDSPALPKPVQSPRPPVIIGGKGKRRTPALTAQYADEFNVPFDSVETTRTLLARVREACAEAGRDADELVYSNALVLCVGRDESELARRAAAIGREVDDLRANALAGTPQEVLDRLGEYADAGSTRVYLQVLDLSDLDHLDLVAESVLPHLP
jgi:F420-dependent oxidoreductase-like protein